MPHVHRLDSGEVEISWAPPEKVGLDEPMMGYQVFCKDFDSISHKFC